MKIAISSRGKEMDSLLDSRFGRCEYYAVYDTEGNKWSFLQNPGVLEGSGAGVRAAQFIIEEGIDVLLTGNLGPNATNILNSAGIKSYALPEVPLEEALKLYQQEQGKLITSPTVDSHAGLTRSDETKKVDITVPQGRIAIATEGNEVAQHFGRCPSYTIVDIEDGKVVNKALIDNPGHQPGFLPRFLAEKGAKCIIAGGMGPRAQGLFAEQGIDVIIGVMGPVEEVIESYLANTLVAGDSFCSHGEGGHGHDCGGH
ncbi:MAG: NifB/NifX family molybdenum-iron cluster-binding protein [Dethiobacteria bacterium]|jgi:predicted Fe-Mo cluster-binding NifX family protein